MSGRFALIRRPGEQEIVSWLSEGRRLLDDGLFAEAYEFGQRLLMAHYTGGYEVLGRALIGLGKPSEARAMLIRATRQFPTVWILWMELGTACSELEQYESALNAYERARTCWGSEEDLVLINMAVACGRAGRFDEALAYFTRAINAGGPHAAVARAERLWVLNSLSCHVQVLEEADDALEALEGLDANPSLRVRAMTELARALTALGRRRDGQVAIRKALQMKGDLSPVLEFIRDQEGVRSESGRFFWMWVSGVQGLQESKGGRTLFLRGVGMVADSIEEAWDRIPSFLEWSRTRFQPGSLKLQSFEEGPSRPGMLKGVYSFLPLLKVKDSGSGLDISGFLELFGGAVSGAGSGPGSETN